MKFKYFTAIIVSSLLSLHLAARSLAQEVDVRYSPEGSGNIVIGDPADDPYLPIFMSDNPRSLWYPDRPNLLNIPVEDEWDFYNLINTDRPDFTDATYTVGRGVTIIENGYTFRQINDHEGNNRQSRRSLPESLVRYGVTDEFELRLKWNGYAMSNIHDLDTGLRTQVFGGDDLYLGIKYELFQQNAWRPMLTMLTGTTVPVGTNGVSSNALQPFINFVPGWGIRRWLYLKMSFGLDWQKVSQSELIGGGSVPIATSVLTFRDNIHVYHGSVSLLFQASKRVGGFVEMFTLATASGADNRPTTYVDTGLFIYATTNVQFDVRIGKRVSERVDEFFTGGGLSLRF